MFLVPNDAKAYQLRGLIYKSLGEKAQEEFKKAKELGYNG